MQDKGTETNLTLTQHVLKWRKEAQERGSQSVWEAGHFVEKILFNVFQHVFMELLLYSEDAGGETSDYSSHVHGIPA